MESRGRAHLRKACRDHGSVEALSSGVGPTLQAAFGDMLGYERGSVTITANQQTNKTNQSTILVEKPRCHMLQADWCTSCTLHIMALRLKFGISFDAHVSACQPAVVSVCWHVPAFIPAINLNFKTQKRKKCKGPVALITGVQGWLSTSSVLSSNNENSVGERTSLTLPLPPTCHII